MTTNKCSSDCGCEGRDFQKEDIMIQRYGYMAHMVPSGDDETPSGTNYHTHGIPQTLNHADIQMIAPLEPKVFGSIIYCIYNFIKEGNQIVPGVKYDKFIKLKVEFAWAIENDRDVLRIILPDTKGELEYDKMEMPYKLQWLGTSKTQTLGKLK